jgi:hypothetical protein
MTCVGARSSGTIGTMSRLESAGEESVVEGVEKVIILLVE